KRVPAFAGTTGCLLNRRWFVGGRSLRLAIDAIPFIAKRLDAHDADELLLARQTNQRHALRIAPDARDFGSARADQRAEIRDQHQLVILAELHGADQRAVPLRALDRDDALRAAALARIFGELGALAEAALCRRQDVVVALDDDEAHDVLARSELHAAHA